MSTIDEIRALRDEIRLQVHLAGMEARTAWSRLEPKVHKLERQLAEGGEEVATALIGTIEMVKTGLYEIRDSFHHSKR